MFNQVKWCPKCCQYCQGNYCSVCGTALEDKQKEVECPCCHGTGKIIMPINDTYWQALYSEQFGPKAVINHKFTEPCPVIPMMNQIDNNKYQITETSLNGNQIDYSVNNTIYKEVEYDDNGQIINVKWKMRGIK